MILRRSFLQRIGGLLLLGSPTLLAADSKRGPARAVAPGAAATLTAVIDLLIPADEVPGAVALGIDTQILASADGDRTFAALVRDGVHWFNAAARARGGASFLMLAEDDRIAVATRAEASPDSTGGRLFATLRNRAMLLYYLHPRVIASFPYAGPPQPQGFPDFAQAPRERS